VRGVVLDLRRNGGGSLDEAVSFDRSVSFVKAQSWQTRGPQGDIDVDADTDPSVLYDGPLVLLISPIQRIRFPKSWSARFQDYGARAWFVGDSSTFGKGTVQKPSAARADHGQKWDWRMPMTPAALKVHDFASSTDPTVPRPSCAASRPTLFCHPPVISVK